MFENLKFFRFEVVKKSFDLDHLLSCMPNLIELKLEEQSLRKLNLQNPVGIYYLELPSEFFEYIGDFVNIAKNIPNLIQLTVKDIYAQMKIEHFAPELAYYLKVLKEHFKNELKFKINTNCFPIKQLNDDSELFHLVHCKSPELLNYLNRIFPTDTCVIRGSLIRVLLWKL